MVRPGVTGFAQTRITREESWADKLAHDMEYIADRSVGLYLSVLVATVLEVAAAVAADALAALSAAVAAAVRPRLPDCARHVRDLRPRLARRRAPVPTARRSSG